MKKILLTIVSVAMLFTNSFSQSIILSQNFNTYDGTAQSIPANWTFSETGQYSFYNISSRSGPSGPNSYRFHIDSATITTPQFTGADSLNFWTRGDATDSASSLTIQYTTDLVTWNTLSVLKPVDHFSTMRQLALIAGTKQLKFIYHKSAGDVAFDDFSVTGPSATGIDDNSGTFIPFTIYPNPTSGPLQINLNKQFKSVKFSIYNMIGNEIKNVSIEKLNDQQYRFNFRNQQPGFYFIRIQTDKNNYTTRVTITASAVQKMVAPDA